MSSRKSVILFCVATFFFWNALYLYVPILGVYAQSLGASLAMVGVVLASYALPQVLFRIPIGIWFDSLKKGKPLVAGGIALTVVGALGLGLAGNSVSLSLGRLICGLGAAAWVTFTIYFVSYFPQDKIVQAVGILNFVTNGAMVAASGGGGAIAEVFGARQTFFASALMGAISFIAILLTREVKVKHSALARRYSLGELMTHPMIVTVAVIGLLLHFIDFASVFGFIPIYGAGIGASDAQLGVITMVALGATAISALATARLANIWSYPRIMAIGALLLGITIAIIPFIHEVNLLLLVQVFNGVGRGMLSTILVTLSIRTVAPQQQATAMGIYQAVYAIGMLLGPLLSGFLANSLGMANIFYLCAFLSLIIAGMSRLKILPKG